VWQLGRCLKQFPSGCGLPLGKGPQTRSVGTSIRSIIIGNQNSGHSKRKLPVNRSGSVNMGDTVRICGLDTGGSFPIKLKRPEKSQVYNRVIQTDDHTTFLWEHTYQI
jgi:hypothetical protein